MQEASRSARKPARAVPRGGRTQTLLRALRARILSLELPPGADVEEAALVREFGLSRTPVREALIQLAADGLVQIVPNRGARVATLELGQVPQMLETLELYQRATTRWAALRRRPEHLDALARIGRDFADAAKARDLVGMAESNRLFHGVIADACGNAFLAADCRAMESRTVRLARAAFGSAHDIADQAAYFGDAVEQHAAILDAIRAGDAERADRLATIHCGVFRRRMGDFVAASAAGEIGLGARDLPDRAASRPSLAVS